MGYKDIQEKTLFIIERWVPDPVVFSCRGSIMDRDHYLGASFVELFRGVYQMSKKPYVIAGLYLLAGYFWSFLSRTESPLPAELIRFHRAEQMARLREFSAEFFSGEKTQIKTRWRKR